MRTRRLWIPTLLSMAVTVAFVAPGDSLTFQVKAKSKLTKIFETKAELASVNFSISVDGEDAHGGVDGPKIEIKDEERMEMTDEYLSVADGRATKLQRTFVKLSGDSLETTSMPEGSGMKDREVKAEKESPFDGKVVVFTWKDDAYTAAWAEGEKGDDDLLEDLEGDTDLVGFLPSKSVSEGDTWDLEAKFFNKVTSPSGRLRLRAKREGKDQEDASIQEEIEKNIEGGGKATYQGTREVDGVKVGVIEVTADLSSHGSVEVEERETGIEYEVTYSGEALWDLEAGHLRSLKLKGEVKFSMDLKLTKEFNGESHELHQKVEFAGDIEHHVTVE
jgi:hypothetical protein